MTRDEAFALEARRVAFETALEALCVEHGVRLVPQDGHGCTEVFFDGEPSAADLALSLPYYVGGAELITAEHERVTAERAARLANGTATAEEQAQADRRTRDAAQREKNAATVHEWKQARKVQKDKS